MAAESIAIEIRKTESYDRWFRKLRDRGARARVLARIRRLGLGSFGDVRAVGRGVFELRIDYGAGYRVYFIRTGSVVVILLCAGDKRTQESDIRRAQRMAAEWKE